MKSEMEEKTFWINPLARWIQSCFSIPGVIIHCDWIQPKDLPIVTSYLDLCNAAVLNALMLYIDPRPTNQKVTPCAPGDVSGRLKNIRTFLRNLQSFYHEVLQQLIVMPLPDLLAIARHPHAEGSGEQMNKVLLLLLGCAVQSEKKEEFIERIKKLEVSLQEAIVEQIQKITNNAECVINIQALELDPDDQVTTTVLHQLQKVVKERDSFAQTVLELNQEQESDSSSGSSSLCNGDVCARKLPECQQHDARSVSPVSTDRHHLGVELASIKAELRKARNELEEKTEIVNELREELNRKEEDVTKLQQDKIELLKEARLAKDCKDELDCLQHKVSKLERVETENNKLREKLSELEFFRSRVEELRQENHILLETRQVLEDQVESWKRRVQQQTDAEVKYVEAQRSLHQIQTEIRQERERICELSGENSRLQKECQSSIEKSTNLEQELELLRNGPNTPRANYNSLGDQMNDSERSRILELELENQKLRSALDENSFTTNQSNTQALRSEIDSLTLSKTSMQEQIKELETNLTQIQNVRETLEEDKKSLEQSLLESNKRFAEFQHEKQKELAVESERKINQLKSDLSEYYNQIEELTTENRSLSQELPNTKQELKAAEERIIEFEESKVTLENKFHCLDREKRCLEKEKSILKDKLQSGDQEFEQARSRLVELERANQRLVGLEERLDGTQARLVDIETEKKQLNQQLELESKKCTRLGDDLITEKTKSADFLTRIQTICGAVGLDWNNLDLSMVDSVVLGRWQETRRERESLKMQCQQKDNTTTDLKSEVEHLRERERARSDETGLIESVRVQELEGENRNVKEQVSILQERIRKLQNESKTKDSEISQINSDLNELKLQAASTSALQSENAKLQVAVRNAELQEDLLRQDNEELQKQCNSLDQQVNGMRNDFEQLQKMHSDLLSDHEQLQQLHEQLNNDYERLKREISALKARQKELKQTDADMTSIRDQCEKDKRTMEDLKCLLSEERTDKERQFHNYALLQNEHSDLKKVLENMRNRNDMMTREINRVNGECIRLKTQQQNYQLSATQNQGKVNELQEALSRKDLDLAKSCHKLEMFSQLNSTLEEESRTILRQNDILIAQNQELLTRALLDKEHYHTEEKDLQEKLNGLRRHKEKLEEKIMDQYKMMENSTKMKKEKQTFVKRAAKALMPKSSPTRVKVRNGPRVVETSSAEDSSALSADECSSYQHNNYVNINDDFYANFPLRNNGVVSSDEMEERETPENIRGSSEGDRAGSSSSQPESSASSEPVNQHSPTKSDQQCDRISWNGSERAVDVPEVPHPIITKPPPIPRNWTRPSGLPPRPPLSTHRSSPVLPPPRRGPRMAPPPYPVASKPISTQSMVNTAFGQQNGTKRPPPPYPGNPPPRRVAVPPDPPKPMVERATPIVIIKKDNSPGAEELFSPPKTSTPKSDHHFSFTAPPSLVNQSEPSSRPASVVNGQISKFPLEAVPKRIDGPSPEHRSRVISLYENLESLTPMHGKNELSPSKSPDDALTPNDSLNTETGDVCEKRDSAIWYEYGCV